MGVFMKSITIHNLDEYLITLIREKAKEEGLSINKTIKILLKKALGLINNDSQHNGENIINVFGSWDEKDVKSFQDTIRNFEKLNP